MEEFDELVQQCMDHFLNDKPDAETLRLRQLSPDAVAQINKLTGKQVTFKRNLFQCRGRVLSRSVKKGKPEGIQVSVTWADGLPVEPPVTKYFMKKDGVWMDRTGSTFSEARPISLSEAISKGLIK